MKLTQKPAYSSLEDGPNEPDPPEPIDDFGTRVPGDEPDNTD